MEKLWMGAGNNVITDLNKHVGEYFLEYKADGQIQVRLTLQLRVLISDIKIDVGPEGVDTDKKGRGLKAGHYTYKDEPRPWAQLTLPVIQFYPDSDDRVEVIIKLEGCRR